MSLDKPEEAYGKYLRSVVFLLIVVSIFLLISGTINFFALTKVIDSSNAIKSCTVTTGKCYTDSARRTGGAVQSINVYTIGATLCADKLDGDDVILRCIENFVKENSNAPR